MSACMMCGSDRAALQFRQTDRLYGTTDKQFGVVRCEQCGLLRLDPQPSPEELHRYYPENYWFAPDTSLVARLEEQYRREVLRGHVAFVERALRNSRARGPLLDVGCGGGLFLGMMRERGFRVAGLDFSREAAALAWRLHGAPAVVADLESAPFRPGTFGGIAMSHVLEHLADPRAYLAAAHRLLQPDGRLSSSYRMPHRGSSACWVDAGTALTYRAICSTIATGTWSGCLRTRALKCCGAITFRCAIIPRVWQPASRRASTRWRAVCVRCAKARLADSSRTWHTSR